MPIFPRTQKIHPSTKEVMPGGFFGNFDEKPLVPCSVSHAVLDTTYAGEPLHYNATTYKVFYTIAGSGILRVNGEEKMMKKGEALYLCPGDVHQVAAVIDAPLNFLALTNKKVNDKHVLSEEEVQQYLRKKYIPSSAELVRAKTLWEIHEITRSRGHEHIQQHHEGDRLLLTLHGTATLLLGSEAVEMSDQYLIHVPQGEQFMIKEVIASPLQYVEVILKKIDSLL